MTLHNITIRPANQDELDNINQLIERAVMTWDLPERVKRLSLPSYYYNTIDLQHFDIIVATSNSVIVGIAAYEAADSTELPDDKTGLLLHGIYVDPLHQGQGIGYQLLNETEKKVKQQQLNGLLVKAQKDAVTFFEKYGMQVLDIEDPEKDYKNRLWKSS